MIDRGTIEADAIKYCGRWGICHVRRLLKLVALIREDAYDEEAVWIAAHLHDWGAYEPWKIEGTDHALRSKEVAEEYLAGSNLPTERLDLILECIEYHHGSAEKRSYESVLMSDADALDFLGVIGIERIFSREGRDLKKAYDVVKKKIVSCNAVILLPGAKKLAAERTVRMNTVLSWFEEDSFGFF